MATLRVDVAAESATEYLHEVINQIGQGFTSGHVDRDTHWEITEWHGQSADDLR